MKTAKIIKNMRERVNLTQKSIAKELGISDRTISSYELCQTKPNPDIIFDIAKICKIEICFKLPNGKTLSVEEMTREYK